MEELCKGVQGCTVGSEAPHHGHVYLPQIYSRIEKEAKDDAVVGWKFLNIYQVLLQIIAPDPYAEKNFHSKSFVRKAHKFLEGKIEELWEEAMEVKAEQLRWRSEKSERPGEEEESRCFRKVVKLVKKGEVSHAFAQLEKFEDIGGHRRACSDGAG